MKANIFAPAAILATLLGTALSTPVPDTAAIVPDSATRNDTGAAVVNPGFAVTDAEKQQAAAAKKCISFTSSNPNWWFRNDGVWGTQKGQFGSGTKQICVPFSDAAGGAMFIGPNSALSPGNTKLECFFPSAGTANCDASLVDGYSLSVTCKADGKTIGGDLNLFKTGETCYDTSLIGQGICKNDRGYAATQKDVTRFFQKGVDESQKYCIWKNCAQDYFFPGTSSISCHVSGGR